MAISVGDEVNITGKHMYCSNKYKFKVFKLENNKADVILMRDTPHSVVLKDIDINRLVVVTGV